MKIKDIQKTKNSRVLICYLFETYYDGYAEQIPKMLLEKVVTDLQISNEPGTMEKCSTQKHNNYYIIFIEELTSEEKSFIMKEKN